MLISKRIVDVPELDALISTHAFLHRAYRLHAVHHRRVVCEDAVILPAVERRGRLGRPIATLLLDGGARITIGSRSEWLEPGDVMVTDSKASIVMRQEGARYAAFAFEWEPSVLGAPPPASLRARLTQSMQNDLNVAFERAVSGSVTASSTPTATSWGVDVVATVYGALREAGLPLPDVAHRDLVEEVPPQLASLSRALDACLSNLHEQPMKTDLEDRLDLSTRQLHRVVLDFNERYGFNAAGWRDVRNRRRLLVGLTLLTCEGATAELVARVVGYRSLSAFSHALTDAGFPPPSAIPAEIAAARDGALRPHGAR